jgi:spore germination cell wall hydrolase CwlJ-like protein
VTLALLALLLGVEVAQRDSDVETLAAVAWSEDPSAAIAVMYTVLNRARIRGTSVYREAGMPHAFQGFSRGQDPWTRSRRCPSCRAEIISLRSVARLVIDRSVKDPTRGATHFHRVGTEPPAWAPTAKLWTTLGAHHFYNVSGWR